MTIEEVMEGVAVTEGSEEVPVYTALPNSSPFGNDYELLAHLIDSEAGAPWVEDEVLYGVGSVVLNRMSDEGFPDTMEEVVYQPGQYAVVGSGRIASEPSERSYAVAADLMENGPTMPAEVVFQANFPQGRGTYAEIQGVYFCYRDEPEDLAEAMASEGTGTEEEDRR